MRTIGGGSSKRIRLYLTAVVTSHLLALSLAVRPFRPPAAAPCYSRWNRLPLTSTRRQHTRGKVGLHSSARSVRFALQIYATKYWRMHSTFHSWGIPASSDFSIAFQDSDIHVSMSQREHYRADGVRIQHDPYQEGMAEKYGRPGETDQEGFDPYAGIELRDSMSGSNLLSCMQSCFCVLLDVERLILLCRPACS